MYYNVRNYSDFKPGRRQRF